MNHDIDESSENVLSEWSRRAGPPARAPEHQPASEPDPESEPLEEPGEQGPAWGTADPARAELVEVASVAELAVEEAEAAPEPEVEEPSEPGETSDLAAPMSIELSHEHAAGELEIPDGYAVLEGAAEGGRRAVGVVVSRFNGQVTSRLLERALTELETAGVRREVITVMVVPGAFELPLAATALAKTRRFACIVALGCVIRGDTPHFDYVASEAASGLQLAALETGVPVSFGILTLDRIEQADARIEKGAEAVRSALEMADVFSQLRAAASR